MTITCISLIAQLVKKPLAIRETLSWKIPWRRERLPTPVSWTGEFQGLYSRWGQKEPDRTEQLSPSRTTKFPFVTDLQVH